MESLTIIRMDKLKNMNIQKVYCFTLQIVDHFNKGQGILVIEFLYKTYFCGNTNKNGILNFYQMFGKMFYLTALFEKNFMSTYILKLGF